MPILDRVLRSRSKPVIAARRLLWRGRAVVQATQPNLGYMPDESARLEIIERREFMRNAFQYIVFNGIPGDYLEFGCNGARTFRLAWSAAQHTKAKLHFWGFDSFEGLPESVDPRDEHPKWITGAMATSTGKFDDLCASHGIPRADYSTVVGFYNESLARTGEPRPDAVALAYVDCDLYTSTMDVLQFLLPRLTTGSLIAFDDYFCYAAGKLSGERLAAREVFGDDRQFRLEPYRQFGWHGMSFVVEDNNTLRP